MQPKDGANKGKKWYEPNKRTIEQTYRQGMKEKEATNGYYHGCLYIKVFWSIEGKVKIANSARAAAIPTG